MALGGLAGLGVYIGAAVFDEFVISGIRDAAEGRVASAACKVVKLCRAGEKLLGAGSKLYKKIIKRDSKLYHYTIADPSKIASEGLVPGATKKVYTTPSGNLGSLQAQIDLALPPNRGPPQHLIGIDVATLRKMGIEIPEAGPVGRMFNMPGGGTEVVFPHALPAEAIKVLR